MLRHLAIYIVILVIAVLPINKSITTPAASESQYKDCLFCYIACWHSEDYENFAQAFAKSEMRGWFMYIHYARVEHRRAQDIHRFYVRPDCIFQTFSTADGIWRKYSFSELAGRYFGSVMTRSIDTSGPKHAFLVRVKSMPPKLTGDEPVIRSEKSRRLWRYYAEE